MRGLTASSDVEALSAQELIVEAIERFGSRLALACSFQKEESVLLDMVMRIDPSVRVFTIDTGALFPETYAAWREFEQRFAVKVEVFDALDPAGVTWSASHCCGERKVAALDLALEGLEGWITGMRREQASTRGEIAKLTYDERRSIWKCNPLADWSEREVWSYIAKHDVPYNALHDQGYASIGCAPCTLPGSGREGRWAGTEKTECGLHVE